MKNTFLDLNIQKKTQLLSNTNWFTVELMRQESLNRFEMVSTKSFEINDFGTTFINDLNNSYSLC